MPWLTATVQRGFVGNDATRANGRPSRTYVDPLVLRMLPLSIPADTKQLKGAEEQLGVPIQPHAMERLAEPI